MAIEWCAGCRQYFDAELGRVYCSDECTERAQRAFGSQQLPPPPKPITLSVNEAWRALSDETGRADAYHQKMRPERGEPPSVKARP